MAVSPQSRRTTRQLATSVLLFTAAAIAACSGNEKSPVGPQLPGGGAAASFKPLAFTADVNLRTGAVRISAPNTSTLDAPSLSLAGAGGPDLSLLGGEAVRLIPTNFQASAVGAFIPGKVRVTFDIVIENKLPGIKFITPTWPTPPSTGVILFPLEQVVTTTPGGVTGGDGNEVIVELPSYGQVVPSIDWSGNGAAGSGAPFSFFNDADCGLATSNDCFRWEAYDLEILPAPATSSVRSVGFDLDPTVGQFRARMVVAADLAAAGVVAPGTIEGTVQSPARGPLSGVSVDISGGFQGSTSGTGTYSVATVAPGTRTVSLSNLPSGCTAPAAQTVGVGSGSTNTVNFSVNCTGLPGSISGVVRRSNDNSLLTGVTVTATGGASDLTDAAGAYSLSGVPAGSGTLTVTGAPAECSASTTPFSLASAGSIVVDITVTCTAPAVPMYQYSSTWSDLGGGLIALDVRVDMRTLDRADIPNVTTSGVTGDPLTGVQMSVSYDATKLTFNSSEAPASPFVSGDPTSNGSTAGIVSVLAGGTTLRTGNMGVVRILFNRVAGSTGSVSTVTNLIAASSRAGAVDVDIRTSINVTEGTFILP